MANEEVEADIRNLTDNLRELGDELLELGVSVQSSGDYCQRFCQTLVQYAGKWKISEDPLPLLEVYTVAIQSYSKARPYLTSECENVCFVLDRLALSCTELLLCLPDDVPDKLWEQFQACVQAAHKVLLEYANPELQMLATLAQEGAVWKNSILDNIFSQQALDQEKVSEFLLQEGPALLELRIRHLVKEKRIDQAMKLAKLCTDHPEIGTKSIFKQTYLTCLCAASPNETLMEEISTVDCKDALEMICNLESDGEEKTALILCTAFLTRQLQQGDLYCAWELTLFWSKLQQRMEPSAQTFLECCRQFSMLSKTVYHIFFLIKVIQSEAGEAGLSSCIELCVRALRMESNENPTVKTSICKTISCLLPDDLEVRRACQLTEFLLEPTVEAYYAVETLYNQPDQKYDDENGPIPNSLRCELLLVLKTHWPFDPEFWDWKTLKRHCLALMGEEASIVSSIDELNDSDLFDENNESHNEVDAKEHSLNGLPKFYSDMVKVQNYSPENMIIKKEKEEKKMERGVVSARFKNWQAYMQYCVLCDREFLGHRIIRHAQTHMKDGNYYCPICAKSFKKKEIFVPHVTFHIKQSCKERMAAIKPKRRVGRPPKNITDNNASPKMAAIDKQEHRPIKRNSLYGEDFVVFSDSDGSDDEGKDKSYKPDITATQKIDCTEDYNCPVTICTKTFKYFKNLIAHVKGHSNEEEAKQFLKMQSNKVVCQYCRRRFVSVSHLNEHLQIHCGTKPYVCIQLECSASFGTYSELVGHRKEHILFKAKCMFQNCGRIFTESYLLYDHEAQHYHSSSYTCRYPNCGKICYSQSEIQKHEVGHVANVRIKTEDQNSSSFDSSQITDNATEQVGNQIDQLMETTVENNTTVKQFDIKSYDISLTCEKPQQERCLQISGDKSDCGQHKAHNQSDSYHNGFAVPCTTNEIKSKSVAQELHSSSTFEDQNSLPNGEYANKVVKTEELKHNISSETLFKGHGTFMPMIPKTSVETVGSEVVESIQRFNCKVEGCSRSYTLARSVSKHIKAVHPEYYEALKKKENLAKVQRIKNPLKCQNQDKSTNPSCLPVEQITNMLSESNQNGVNNQLVTSVLKVENGNVSQPRKKRHTHNKRAKWPAIIKGDKFICSRCYREFTNPKSLGGHLSRRAICKPYDGKESLANVGQKNGQALYQAEKILSTSAFTPQAREPPYIPDTFLPGETFLQSFEMGDSATSFGAHEIFSPTHESSYHSTVFESSKSLQQALEDAGSANTFETEVIQQTFQTSFDTNAVEDNPAMASTMAVSQALKAVCSPGSFVASEGINAEVSPMLNPVKDTALFSPCDSLQQTLESNFCSGPYVGNEINPQDMESNCEAPIFVANEPLPEIINATTTTCNYIAQGSVPDAACNTSPPEESKTFDTRIAELLMGLQNLNLESDAKLFSSNEIHGSSMNILTPAPTNHCTENPDSINPCLTTPQTNTQQQIAQTENNKEVKVNLVKPFVCQDEGCVYSAMTKDALTNHYVKVHQYSRERIMEIKMYQTRFAPFRCHVPNCQKTFTRNSNLRAHYQSVHHVAREELVKLRIKRAYCRKSESSDRTAESIQPVKEIISQPAINNSQEKDSKCHTELEPVAIGPNEFGPYLHSTQNAQTVLCNDGMPQDDLVLLAGLQNGLVLPAGPQDILIAAEGLPNDSALAVEPHVATLLVASTPAVGPQSVSLLPAGLQSVSLILPEPENSSLLSAGPQDVLGPQMVLPQVSPLLTVPQLILPQVSSLPIGSEVLLSSISPLPIDLQVALPLVSPLPTCPQVVSPQISPMPAGPQVVSPPPVESEISSPLSTMPQVVLPPSAGPNVVSSLQEATVHPARSEVMLAHEPGGSMQQNNSEGDLNQAQNIECTLNQAQNLGEKRRRKAITKIKAQYDVNKFHKPYKCVHKGCSAAFTIQQNLILHYRAVHQSDQAVLLCSEIKEESTQNENIQVRKEFSCQLDDCCRIFQGVTDLIKHYAELHDLALDEMGKLVSSMSEGKFHCDQAQCISSFTVFWSFIKHLLVAHGIDVESKDSDQEMACFKCDCEGCDRTYATRSNLLRHIFTKHRELHRSHLMRPRRIIPTDQENITRTASQEDLSDGKDYLGSEEFSENEDTENYGKSKPVSRECFTSDSNNLNGGEVDDSNSYSSRKIGKYTFKSKAQALAMCSCKSLREQYPCMFESCSSVVTSESSLVKHYRIHHKISNTFVSQYYNHLITCRTYSSAQGKESTEYVSNGQEGSVENAINGDVVQQQVKLSETEILNKRVEKDDLLKSSFDELSEMFNAKLVNDANGSAENKTGLEKMVEMSTDNKFTNVNNHQPCKKRSNNHLTHSNIEKECVQSKKKKNLAVEKPEQLLEDNVSRTLHEKAASLAPDNSPCLNKGQHHKTFDLSTFKPMGFEVSFLKFLEESAVKRKKKPVANKGPCHSGSTANARKTVDGGFRSSKVVAGNNSSSATLAMKGDERSGVPFNHNKVSVVDRLCVETTESQTLSDFSNPLSLHILKNIKVIMDKTHSDCVELAQKQLQHMQPTVVLSRIKVDINMLAQVKRMKESIALKSK